MVIGKLDGSNRGRISNTSRGCDSIVLVLLTYCLGLRDHITGAFISLHWLQVPECVKYKVAVLTYKALHNTVPHYLGPLVHVADIPGQRALRSAVTDRLAVPSVCLYRCGNRALSVDPVFVTVTHSVPRSSHGYLGHYKKLLLHYITIQARSFY